MKVKSIKTIVILIVSILYLGSGQSFAQKGSGNGPKGKCGAGSCCNIPDLTEAQQKKIGELKITHQKNMLQLKNQMDLKHAQLQLLTTAEKPDMVAINKAIEEIGAVKIQMMKEKEDHHQQIRAQLTEAQRVQFDLQRNRGMHGSIGKGGMGMCGNKGSFNFHGRR